MNYALGTNRTLETYAEPFASTGRYFRLGDLQAAQSYKLCEYGADGIALVRRTTSAGSLVRPASLYDALTATGDNVFAIKLNYWLPF